MKKFTLTLAAVACVALFLPLISVNCEDTVITMISTDGSYMPGNIEIEFVLHFQTIHSQDTVLVKKKHIFSPHLCIFYFHSVENE